MTAIPFAISARHKGFNRAEVVDQNFIEFVQFWDGETATAPRKSRAMVLRCCRAVRWMRAAFASCSNHS
jgi:2-oxoisovalerate dehydrogenase E1 component